MAFYIVFVTFELEVQLGCSMTGQHWPTHEGGLKTGRVHLKESGIQKYMYYVVGKMLIHFGGNFLYVDAYM